jgi:hypothetical protein
LGGGVLAKGLRGYIGKGLARGQLVMSPIVLFLLPVLLSLSLALIWQLPIGILIVIVVIPVEPFGFGLVPALVEVVILADSSRS